MIIRSLVAENFRKYKRLEIENVPEKGLITIGGENESGKTSIADALSFALFGRTFLTTEKHANKLIAWGEKNTMVVLNFINKGKPYQLTRIVNHEGEVDAQLFSEEKAELLADTPEETEIVLQGILGYGYETFSDSFYLVQRELSTPHPNSDSIKDMVGINTYSKISNECYRANERDEEELNKLQPKYAKAYKNLQDMRIDDSWLPELVETRDIVETDQDYKYQLVSQLRNSADHYTEDRKQFIKVQRKHGFLSIFSDILLAILVVTLGLWGAIKFFPEWAKNISLQEGVNNFSEISTWSELWMPLFAASLALVFLISMFLTWRTEDKQLDPLRNNSQLYSEALNESHKHAKAEITDNFAKRSLKVVSQASATLSEIERNNDQFARVHTITDEVMEFHAGSTEADKVADLLRLHMKEQQRHNDSHLVVLNTEIDREMERTAVASGFRQELSGFDNSIREHSRNIKVQNTAIDLLRSSAIEFTDNFNSSITQSSAKILPFFTNDHYSNVKINEDLNIAVFSKEKNDFMDFDEISSGTQRQIMLALRIAMSEELANTNDNDQQFIILDEPFAFFDDKRTIATLEMLPKVSNIISQVWVASQEFPEGTDADKEIVCIAGNNQLIC